jgi:enoyl-CoA hydratase/carnithine racemase
MTDKFHPRLPIAREGATAVVTFDRPEVRNAFDLSMWRGLHATMAALSAEDDLRCVVLRGAGTRAFCAGADIAAFAEERGSRTQEDVYSATVHDAMQAIRLCRHPVVAMLMGACIGGGAGIATMCDFRVGGEGLRFGITARNLGIWYAYAEIDPIIGMVGTAVAAEILIEGRIFTGAEAYTKGLLSRLVPDEAVAAEAMALAGRIGEGSPLSARFHKAALRRLRGELPVTPAEEQAVNDFADTEDFHNAARAFVLKRKPVWRSR